MPFQLSGLCSVEILLDEDSPNMPRCSCLEIGIVLGAFLESWPKLSGLPLRASAGMARSCPAAEPILMML